MVRLTTQCPQQSMGRQLAALILIMLEVAMTAKSEKDMRWRYHQNNTFLQGWHEYIDKVMQLTLSKTFSNGFLKCLTGVLLIKMKYSNNFISYAKEVLQNTQFPCKVLKASGRITLQTNRNIMHFYVRHDMGCLMYTWSFHIHRCLSLKISVENIQFGSGYLECRWGRLTINKFKSVHHSFIYCGHQTNFHIYPSYSDMNITIHSHIYSIFTFSASYTILTKNQFVSISTSTLKISVIFRIYLIENDILFCIFHIKVKKIHKIIVLFPQRVSYKIQLYDGPGFLSPVL